MYQAASSDRNMYSKQLIECKDEMTDMKRRIKILVHQIDQLKEEIAVKVRGRIKKRKRPGLCVNYALCIIIIIGQCNG